MSDTLRERVARAIDESLCNGRVTENNLFYLPEADAAIALVLEEAARVAEGPVYRTSGTGEVSIRGTDKGNWSVPMPISGFTGSDYGTGRYNAAAAIRALKEEA